MRFSAALVTLLLWTAPALAHAGEHGGMAFSKFLSHVLETDHIVFAAVAVAVAVGILSYRAGRRAEAHAAEVRAKGDHS